MPLALTVGQVARATGVTPGTVRYYEQLGLLPRAVRTAAGYRMFPEHAVRRLRVVRAAQQFGFPLREIAAFFSVRDAGGRPCQLVRGAAQQMLHTLDTEIDTLRSRRRSLRRTLHRWDEILAHTPMGQRALLLETLPDRRR